MHDFRSDISRRFLPTVVVVALVFPTLITWVYFVWLKQSEAAVQQSAYAVGKALQFALPIAWVFLIERRRPQWTAPKLWGIVENLVFGLLVLAAMLALWHYGLKPSDYLQGADVEIRKKVLGMGLGTPARFIAVGVFYSLCHSFLEEYYWRWFVFGQLQKLVPRSAAVLLSSLGFMAHHVLVLGQFFGTYSLATAAFSLSTAVGGAVWAWLYHRHGSLIGPWLSHALVDAGIFIIGYDVVGNVLGS